MKDGAKLRDKKQILGTNYKNINFDFIFFLDARMAVTLLST